MNNKELRRDCMHYMKTIAVADFFSQWLQILLPTVSAFLIGKMTDYLLVFDTVHILETLPAFLIAMVCNVFLVPLCVMMVYQQMAKKGFAYDAYMLNRFFRKPLREIEKADQGELLQKIEGDLGDFSWNVVFLYDIPMVLATYFVVIIYLFYRNTMPLTYAVCVLILPSLKVIKANVFAKKEATFLREQSEYMEEKRSIYMETFEARDFIRLYRLKEFFLGKAETSFHNYWKKSGKQKAFVGGIQSMLDFLFQQGTPLIVIAAGAYLMEKKQITAGTVLGAMLMLSPIEQWFTYAANWLKQQADYREYCERIRIFYGEIETEEEGVSMRDLEIYGDNLAYTYDGERYVFQNRNVTVKQGEVQQVEGKNGSGKSTLFMLLSGLYTPTEGSIHNQRSENLSMKDLRKNVALQEQDGYVFSGTIGDNLFLSDDGVEVAEQMRKDFKLDKELNYQVSSSGANLSPGEKKKIILMRALLKKAEIYIFDEPYNHLDAEGKRTLERYLGGMKKGIVMASHQK